MERTAAFERQGITAERTEHGEHGGYEHVVEQQSVETEEGRGEVALAEKPAGRRRFCGGCVAVGLVGVVVILLCLVLLFSSPQELVAYGKQTLSGPSTVEIAIAQASDAQARVLRELRPSVTLTLTDADVNAYIATHRDELALPGRFKDPRVAFGEGFVEGSVRTKLVMFPVRARIKVRPEIREGKLLLVPEAGRAGKLPMPRRFRQKIAKAIGRLIGDRLSAAGFDLQGVEVHKGLLIVRGVLRPTEEDARQERADDGRSRSQPKAKGSGKKRERKKSRAGG